MADPLGLIAGAGGPSPIQPRTPAGGVPLNPAGPSFKDVLLKNLDEVNRLQQDAQTAIEDLASGKRGDVEGVMIATQKADTAFKALQAVRNKVIQAYEEVQQMRV
ncbi:MAG: flagellar hook-basal body complex protein FliE [Phycisphaerales bacterium]